MMGPGAGMNAGRTSDFRHQTSDLGLHTSDIRLQTPDFSGWPTVIYGMIPGPKGRQ